MHMHAKHIQYRCTYIHRHVCMYTNAREHTFRISHSVSMGITSHKIFLKSRAMTRKIQTWIMLRSFLWTLSIIVCVLKPEIHHFVYCLCSILRQNTEEMYTFNAHEWSYSSITRPSALLEDRATVRLQNIKL